MLETSNAATAGHGGDWDLPTIDAGRADGGDSQAKWFEEKLEREGHTREGGDSAVDLFLSDASRDRTGDAEDVPAQDSLDSEQDSQDDDGDGDVELDADAEVEVQEQEPVHTHVVTTEKGLVPERVSEVNIGTGFGSMENTWKS